MPFLMRCFTFCLWEPTLIVSIGHRLASRMATAACHANGMPMLRIFSPSTLNTSPSWSRSPLPNVCVTGLRRRQKPPRIAESPSHMFRGHATLFGRENLRESQEHCTRRNSNVSAARWVISGHGGLSW